MRLSFLALLFITVITTQAHSQRVLIEDDGLATVKSPKSATTGNDLRKVRRVGVGVSGAGPLGLGGVHFELNFTPRSGMLLGFGGGPGFQAYTFQYKSILAGEWLLPYMSAGFSRWMNFSQKGPIEDTTPGILAERFMSDEDKARGRIDEYLLYPGFGLQYVQLSGRWAGFSIFSEVIVLIDLVDFVAAPTGTLGMSYYF